MATIEIPPERVGDALRSGLIFLPPDGSVTAVPGGLRVLTPSNPTFWWGNFLRFDAPPGDGDLARWTALFDDTIRARQRLSTHHAFGWDGDDIGAIEPFVAAGFAYFEVLSLGVERGDAVTAPHPTGHAIAEVDGARWLSVRDLLVVTRDPVHGSAEAYLEYLGPQIEGWQRLQHRGHGRWFCIEDGDVVVAALGVFAEQRPGVDGRRIGRFQHVATHPAARRRGYAGTLVAHAARFALDRLDVDALRISADAHDVARRVYESCGFTLRSRHHALERGS